MIHDRLRPRLPALASLLAPSRLACLAILLSACGDPRAGAGKAAPAKAPSPSPTPTEDTPRTTTPPGADDGGRLVNTAVETPLTFRVEGRPVPIKSVLVWSLNLTGTAVPQLVFYREEVTCAKRLTYEGERVYSALLAPDGLVPGSYDVPNWGYSAMGDRVPLGRAQVTLSEVTKESVKGVARFVPEACGAGPCKDGACPEGGSCRREDDLCVRPCGFALEGAFTATRCPDTTP